MRSEKLNRPRMVCTIIGVIPALISVTGCASAGGSSRRAHVIVLDGAGWSGSHRRIRQGLREAGYPVQVESFPWTSFLGPGTDHVWVTHKQQKGRELAKRVYALRRRQPYGRVHLVGLSAGTAVVIFALEQLPPGVAVDNVILLSPSVSERHDLSDAMLHVRGHLYATSSPYDKILLGLTMNADGLPGRPAGLYGFRIPSRIKRYELYTRVVHLPWRSAYADLGWDGSHTGVTRSQFVRDVLASRMMSTDAQPADRPMAPRWLAQIKAMQTVGVAGGAASLFGS